MAMRTYHLANACSFCSFDSLGRQQVHYRGTGLDDVIHFAKQEFGNASEYSCALNDDLFAHGSDPLICRYLKLANTKAFIKPRYVVSYTVDGSVFYGSFLLARLIKSAISTSDRSTDLKYKVLLKRCNLIQDGHATSFTITE